MSRLKLYCPICGKCILIDSNRPTDFYHTDAFGWICSEPCYQKSKIKYTNLILLKDDLS